VRLARERDPGIIKDDSNKVEERRGLLMRVERVMDDSVSLLSLFLLAISP